MSYIDIIDLCKYYINSHPDEKSIIFNNFNLIVNKGDFITIFGPNGCGKSTLLRIIAGITDYNGGSVLINDKSPEDANIGFIFQNFRDSIFPWRSTLKNISFPLEIKGIEKKAAVKQAEDFIEEADLINLFSSKNSFPYQLSGGMQQLVAISRALITNPDVLLMDEPFASLDFQTRLMLQNKLNKIWLKTKTTVIFVSHEVNEAIYLGTKLLILSNKPTCIKKSFENPFQTERDHSILTSKEFLDLKKNVTQVFSEEI